MSKAWSSKSSRRATTLIQKHRPILYVENDRLQNSDALIRFIASLGYKLYWHRPTLFNSNNFLRNPTNVFGNIASHNLLCFHVEQPHVIQGLEAIAVS